MSDKMVAPDTPNAALSVPSSNFESRKIQIIGDDTLRIKPTFGSLALSVLFFAMGLGLCGLWAAKTFAILEGGGSIPMLLVGVMFGAAGIWTYHSSNEQLIINRDVGVAFIKSWLPDVPLDTTLIFKHIKPQDITAIQTISRVVKGRSNRSRKTSHYTEYQVNLCTAEDGRHNVFVTLKEVKAEDFANRVAKLFDVPLETQ